MKKRNTLLSLLFFAMSMKAQPKNTPLPALQKKMEYQVHVQGSTFTYFITIDSLASHKRSVHWQSLGGREGSYIISKNAIDSAQYGYWNPPQPGTTIELENEQSLLIFSRATYQQLKKHGNMLYDGNTFQVNGAAGNSIYKIGDSQVDCLYAETADGGTKIWMYDNPHLPIILKIEGNPFGVDVALTGIQ
jgi:hypothetical protein